MPIAAVVLAILGIAIACGNFLVGDIIKELNRSGRIAIWVVSIACISGAAYISAPWRPTTDKITSTPVATSDDTVLVNCEFAAAPMKMPPEGYYWAWLMWPLPAVNGGGGLMKAFGAPGEDIQSPYKTAYRCAVTNYGKAIIFNVRLSFGMKFREAVKDEKNPNSVHSGKVTLSRDWIIDVGELDVGSQKSFQFWVVNNNDLFGVVTLPTHVQFTALGSNKPIAARLIRPSVGSFFLSPPPAKSSQLSP